jgi:hypothetical protein
VVENNGSGITPPEPSILQKVVQVTDFSSNSAHRSGQQIWLSTTSNTCEHTHPRWDVKDSSRKPNHTSAPVDVVEEISYESPSLFTGRQQLSQQIGLVYMSDDITSPPFVIGHSLKDKMVCNAL